MSIGKNLTKLREKLNISHKDMADTLEVSTRMLRFYEKNEYPVNSDAIMYLIKKYNINPTWLFLGKGEILLDEEACQQFISTLKINEEEVNSIIQEIIKSKDAKEAVLQLLNIRNSDKETLNNVAELLKTVSQ